MAQLVILDNDERASNNVYYQIDQSKAINMRPYVRRRQKFIDITITALQGMSQTEKSVVGHYHLDILHNTTMRWLPGAYHSRIQKQGDRHYIRVSDIDLANVNTIYIEFVSCGCCL